MRERQSIRRFFANGTRNFSDRETVRRADRKRQLSILQEATVTQRFSHKTCSMKERASKSSQVVEATRKAVRGL